jgi:hypothetical protein
MTFILFNIETGHKIKEFATEEDARKGLRQHNNNAGWTKIGMSWTAGIELEVCSKADQTQTPPYGITEWERWIDKFTPQIISTKNDRFPE